ncbi:MAG TPA: cob(I)yrinic acid a,c-diamide adenosyltransferase [Acidimicrobiales bacterium]|nr:cob(I)yrinic acid a,c-diamide adenosyltransferase [Acidimicrobiales bacterium]
MRIYTRTGDRGTTGLLFGGRVAKDSEVIEANGAVDEAQAALGLARAEVERGSELDGLLVGLERDLYVLMAEVATAPGNRRKLKPGVTLVTADMVGGLEARIDELAARFPPITDFVIPGHDRVSASLDMARTVTRRAERAALRVFPPAGPGVSEAEDADRRASGEHQAGSDDDDQLASAGSGQSVAGAEQLSLVVQYLNRLSDLLWTMARWQEQGDSLLSRKANPHP